VDQVTPGEYVTIRLQAPASLSVRVAGAAPGLMATIGSGDTDVGELTPSGPETWQTERLAPGDYDVEVVGEHGGAAGRVTVTAGQQARVSLTYRPWARLRGRVVKPDGTPAAGVFFTIDRDEDVVEAIFGHELYMLMRARLDDDGHFDVAVAEGPGKLVITSANGVAEVAVDARAGVNDVGEVALQPIR
jgi:hypothetical protein